MAGENVCDNLAARAWVKSDETCKPPLDEPKGLAGTVGNGVFDNYRDVYRRSRSY